MKRSLPNLPVTVGTRKDGSKAQRNDLKTEQGALANPPLAAELHSIIGQYGKGQLRVKSLLSAQRSIY